MHNDEVSVYYTHGGFIQMAEIFSITFLVFTCAAIVALTVTYIDRRKVVPVEELTKDDLTFTSDEHDAEMYYQLKFGYFTQLCQFSKGGRVTVPSWKSLGDTEAEKARNLLLIKEYNITLKVEDTGDVITPQTAELALR
jgi:hypothetical protein